MLNKYMNLKQFTQWKLDVRYVLKAIIYHQGTIASAGHVTMSYKEDNQWFYYDDMKGEGKL